LAANTQEQELVGNAPIVAHANFALDPNEARREAETPGIDHVERLSQKGVGRPEVQVGVIFDEMVDGLGTDSVD
jgi:hypothetical protein